MFSKKLDENGIITRNKSRLVGKGYNQAEVIDYDETYTPITHLKIIRVLLVFSCCLDFKLYQMDVKSAFLNNFENEEIYGSQPPGFEDHENPDYIFKLKQAIYGLKQAHRAWYEHLSGFLIK